MKKTIFQSIHFTAVAALAGLVLLLSGCGGGGGSGNTAGLNYPDCSIGLTGTDSLAGCWVSEVCGTGGETEEVWGAQGVRYLAWISEEQVSPTIKGSIEHYYLRYNNNQCTGQPFAIADFQQILANEGVESIMEYDIPGFDTCTDLADTAITPTPIACTQLNLFSDYRARGSAPGGIGVETSIGTYDDGIIDTRLCFGGGMFPGFNPDNANDFGIGHALNPSVMLPTELDYLNCLARFTP
ncbi:MAG: hypothetical protein L3K25_07840 [Gammaproteobacteria bacterium]|nr:hypothetical protein [Gammaproteobacteria bacterium]